MQCSFSSVSGVYDILVGVCVCFTGSQGASLGTVTSWVVATDINTSALWAFCEVQELPMGNKRMSCCVCGDYVHPKYCHWRGCASQMASVGIRTSRVISKGLILSQGASWDPQCHHVSLAL